jgi:hypothetical protein
VVIGFFIFTEIASAASPHDVESSVKNAWKNGTAQYGTKDFAWTSGKRLVYDVYNHKYLPNGWTLETRNFNGTSQKYLKFHGWAVLSGYKKHSSTNHSTHIVLRKTAGDTGLGSEKIYKTIPLNIDASKDLEYNSQSTNPDSIWNECSSSATNQNNLTCNMRYESVGFTAYIPLNELFSNPNEKAEWQMFLIKRVDSHIVYSPLIVPFEFNELNFLTGKIDLSSGVDSKILRMNDHPVIRRSYARQPASSAANKYFTKGDYYTNLDMEESKTAVWYGVKTPEDSYAKRWANTTYWTFAGQQASLSYIPPPYEPNVTVKGNESACTQEQVQLTARVVKGDGSVAEYKSNSNLTWSTSNSNVATVNSSGLVNTKNSGTATITATYKDTIQNKTVTDTHKITVSSGCSSTPPDVGSSCPRVIGSPSNGSNYTKVGLTPTTTGSISAEGTYDVSKGIPTSEKLKVESSTNEYLFNQDFQQKKGDVKYTVDIVKGYKLKWTETVKTQDNLGNPITQKEQRERIAYVKKSYTVDRPYSYWLIDKYEVYGLKHAYFDNYALPNEEVTIPYNKQLLAFGNHKPNVQDHVFPAECEPVDKGIQTIDGGNSEPSLPNENFTSDAEKAVGKNQVKNDKATFENTTILKDSLTDTEGPSPSSIPNAPQVKLEKGNILISSDKRNKANTVTLGLNLYTEVFNLGGKGGDQYSIIEDLSSVTVHTPVVIYGRTSNDKEFNQKTKPSGENAFILDRPFTVETPTSGQHVSYPGYGNRNYAKYIKEKQIRFPFDVYHYDSGVKGIFIPANTWVDIPVNEVKSTFFLPVWVKENNYEVLYRTFAENAPASGFTTQSEANTSLENHVAVDTVPVDVIGRVYDFRVTDIADYNWEKVFRIRENHFRHSDNFYWTGKQEIDGGKRGNSDPFILPIRPGSHPDFKNVSVKTGYHFKFDLKTKGNMAYKDDAIRITPSFYFVNKNGGNRQKVDLYYQTEDNPFVKIGGEEDKEKRYVILTDRYRNVPIAHLTAAAAYSFDHYSDSGSTIKSRYIQKYIDQAKERTWIGTYDWLILNYRLKTHIGPSSIPTNASASVEEAKASVQQWYGEYSLPANVFVVPEGTNLAEKGRIRPLTDKSPIFLKDGYIIVNFDIETIDGQDLVHPRLQYINAPLSNQWKREGFPSSVKDASGNEFQLKDGDVVFYHGDKSSYDDFNSNITH